MIPTSRFAAITLAILAASLEVRATDPNLDGAFVTTISPGLTPNGYVPPPAAPNFSTGTGAVNAVALQSDGKIIAGGNISRYQAPPAGSPQSSLKRLNPDGSIDTITGFNTFAATLADTQGDTEVNKILTVAGDKLYVGGVFTNYQGATRSGLMRLNADGSLDTSFNTIGISNSSTFGMRYVLALAEQPDGKLLVGGGYNRANGTFRPGLARFNSDGTLDTTFNSSPALPADTAVHDIAILPDGQILVAGGRPRAGGGYVTLLARLNSDGSLDPSLSPSFTNDFGDIDELLVLPDGRILIGGDFSFLPSGTSYYFACLLPDGTLDTAFMANVGSGPSGWAGGEIALQPDGTIFVGGIFKSWNGQPRASIARVNLDGTLDPVFSPAPYVNNNSYTTHFYSFAFQPDGKLVVGGWFPRVSDPAVETYNITRFVNEYSTGPGILRALSPAVTTAENAGSVALAVSRFGGLSGEVSANYTLAPLTAVSGTDYTPVSGTLTWATGVGGIRTIPVPILQDAAQDGLKTFQLTLSNPTGGATLPPANATTLVNIRDDDAPPVIVLEPAAVSVDQGASLSLGIHYESVLPATVQWQRDPDGAGPLLFENIPGATSLLYTVSAADPTVHAGSYRAVVTNPNGSDTSLGASVTVKIPAGSVVTSFVPPADTPAAKFAALDASGRFLLGDLIGLRRLSATGTLEPTTAFGINVSGLNAILHLADGRTLLGGDLGTLTHLPTNISSTVSNRLVRLNADGTIDGTYSPTLNGAVNVLASGTSGKFYAGVIGATSIGLQRFTSTGAADGTFSVPSSTIGFGTAGLVSFVKEQSDGKVLVSYQNGTSGFGGVTYRLTRLTSAGALDTSFGAGGHVTLPCYLTGVDVLPDGRIAIAARFNDSLFGSNQYLALLQPDGTFDASFQFPVGRLNGNPWGLIYRDGRLLVWGAFTTVNGSPQAGLLRLNLDGSSDPTFAVGTGIKNTGFVASPSVNTALYTSTGDIFIAGDFTSFKGITRNRAALLDGGPGALGVSPATLSVLENAGTATVTVKRFGKTTSAVSVSYATLAETATAGTDFTAASGSLSWAANDSADKTVTIPLTDNPGGEPEETFRLSLSLPTPDGAATLLFADAVVTIVDDDNLPTISTHPVSQVSSQGGNLTFTITATGVPAPTYRWTKDDVDVTDGADISGSGTPTLSLTNVGTSSGGVYRCRVTNTNGSVTSNPATLDIALNPAFIDATWPTNLTINQPVSAIALAPDGTAYIAGQFTNFNNISFRNYLVKISPTGVLDTNFNPIPNAAVTKLILDGDRLYVMGSFSQIGAGAVLNGFAAIDASTGANLASYMLALGSGAGGTVRDFALLSDGDLLLGGDFNSYNGNASHRYLARINRDGSLHAPFNTTAVTIVLPPAVTAVAAGANGSYVAGGSFFVGSQSRLARFHPDGSQDTAFAPTGMSNATFKRIRVLPDGRVMASGGPFTSNLSIIRLSATGAWDSADFAGAANVGINDFVFQTNGSTVGVGSFTLTGTPVNFTGIAAFNSIGALDTSWVGGAGLSGVANTIALGENGSLWIGGTFNAYNGTAVQNLVRLNGYLIPLAITLQPKGLEANPSDTATFTSRATGTSNLSYRWLKNDAELFDGGNVSGATTPTLTVSNLSEADEATYSLRATNLSGNVVSDAVPLVVLGAPEILTQPASTLSSYTLRPLSLAVTARGVAPLTYQWRKGVTPLTDGGGITGTATPTLNFGSLTLAQAGDYYLAITGTSTIIGGPYTVAVTTNPVERVAALSSVATSVGGTTYSILPLADGGALVGGQFSNLVGNTAATSGTHLGRVLPDGSVAALPLTLDGAVRELLRLPGGKFLVAGEFTTVTPTGGSALTRNRLLRLNADFSLDTTFDVGTGPDALLRSLAVDAQGRIYAAGDFTTWNGNPARARLVRLSSSGIPDPTFTATFNNSVFKIAISPTEGQIYVGGGFSSFGGINYLARLTETGARDATFSHTLANGVTSLAIQADGKLLVLSGTTVSRLLDTGAADPTFPATAATGLADVALQADGRILLSGTFTTFGGVTRYGPVRLTSGGALDPTFTITGNTAGLAFTRADGYGRLWLGGSLTAYNGTTTTRGLTLVHSDPIPLGIVQAPDPAFATLGQTITFSVTATGTMALSYQWTRDNVPISDDGRYSGVTTATLTLNGTLPTDEGLYRVTVANASAPAVTSASAELIFLAAPEITDSPDPLAAEVGESISLYAEARGAGNLTYQWLKGDTVLANSATISGATTPLLVLSSIELTDGGDYKIRVTNTLGNTTSAPATLTVVRNPSSRAPGVVIPTFNNTINAVLPLADGTFLVGGTFTTVTLTQPLVSASRSRFAKINSDGTPDLTWPVFNNEVTCIAADSAGRIYVGGNFGTVTHPGNVNTARLRLVRLLSTGAIDTTFTPLAGPSGIVRGIKFDATGRIYIHGDFSNYRSESGSAYIARLNDDGSRDATFVSSAAVTIPDLDFAPGNRLWLSHSNAWGSGGQSRIVLVDEFGVKDPGFTYTGVMSSNGVEILADGSVLSFSTNSSRLQKISPTGAIASPFPVDGNGGPNNGISKHGRAGDQFYLYGSFTGYAGIATGNFVRINADGTRDTTFDAGVGFNSSLQQIVTDAQGRVWCAGNFTAYKGDTSLARLVVLNGGVTETNSGPPADPLLAYLEAAGIPSNLRGPNDDADNDSLDNLLEYALDLNPNGSGGSFTGSAPTVVSTPALLSFTYRRVRNDVTYVVESAATLAGPWTTGGVAQGTPAGDGTTTASIPVTPGSRFLRLAVTR